MTTTSSSFTANLSASSSTLAYDREFLRTLPGLLMVAEIVSGAGEGGSGCVCGGGRDGTWFRVIAVKCSCPVLISLSSPPGSN